MAARISRIRGKAVALIGHAEAPLSGLGHAFTGGVFSRLTRLDRVLDVPPRSLRRTKGFAGPSGTRLSGKRPPCGAVAVSGSWCSSLLRLDDRLRCGPGDRFTPLRAGASGLKRTDWGQPTLRSRALFRSGLNLDPASAYPDPARAIPAPIARPPVRGTKPLGRRWWPFSPWWRPRRPVAWWSSRTRTGWGLRATRGRSG